MPTVFGALINDQKVILAPPPPPTHAYTFKTVKVVIAITVHKLLCTKETLQ